MKAKLSPCPNCGGILIRHCCEPCGAVYDIELSKEIKAVLEAVKKVNDAYSNITLDVYTCNMSAAQMESLKELRKSFSYLKETEGSQ